jgi:hypothetical protein
LDLQGKEGQGGSPRRAKTLRRGTLGPGLPLRSPRVFQRKRRKRSPHSRRKRGRARKRGKGQGPQTAR